VSTGGAQPPALTRWRQTGCPAARYCRQPGTVGAECRDGPANGVSGTPVSLLTGSRQRRAGRANNDLNKPRNLPTGIPPGRD